MPCRCACTSSAGNGNAKDPEISSNNYLLLLTTNSLSVLQKLNNIISTMVQLKPSLLLSTVAALSIPLAAKAQGEFLTCIFTNMATGGIVLGGNATELIGSVKSLCCPEGSEDPTCIALGCTNLETGTMNEPCTCGVAMMAQEAMKADETLSSQITMFMPGAFSQVESVFASCCPSEETSATEVNTCLADLRADDTTTEATGPAGDTTTEATESAGDSSTEATEPATTTGATESAETTDTTTEPAEPASAPSSGSIASVSLPIIMVAYALFNYVM